MARGIKIPVSLQVKDVNAGIKQLKTEVETALKPLIAQTEKLVALQKMSGDVMKKNSRDRVSASREVSRIQREVIKDLNATIAAQRKLTKSAVIRKGKEESIRKASNETTKALQKQVKTANRLADAMDNATKTRRGGGGLMSPGGSAVIAGGIAGVAAAITSKLIPALGRSSTAAIRAAATNESLTLQFKTLLGSMDAAIERMESLRGFAAATPFQLEEIAKASRLLQVLTNGALSTEEGLRLVGDTAAAVGTDIENLSMWVGRAYDGLKANRPIGEATMRLQELGVVSGDVRNRIEDLQKAGEGTKAWQVLRRELERNSGAMKDLSQTGAGLFSTLKDTINEALIAVGTPALEKLKLSLRDAIAGIEDFAKSPAFDQLVDGFTQIVDIARAVVSVGASVLQTLNENRILVVAGAIATLAANAGALGVAFSALAANPVIAAIAAVGAGVVIITKNFQDTIDEAGKLEKKITSGFKLTESQIVDVNTEINRFEMGLERIAELEATGNRALKPAIQQRKRENELTKQRIAALLGVKSVTDSFVQSLPALLKAEEKQVENAKTLTEQKEKQKQADDKLSAAKAAQAKIDTELHRIAAEALSIYQKRLDVQKGLSSLGDTSSEFEFNINSSEVESAVERVGRFKRQLEALQKLGIDTTTKEYVAVMSAYTEAVANATDAQTKENGALAAKRAELAAINEEITKLGGSAVQAGVEVDNSEIESARERSDILRQIRDEERENEIALQENRREQIQLQKEWEISQEREKFEAQLELLKKHGQDTAKAEANFEKKKAIIEAKAKKDETKIDKAERKLKDQQLQKQLDDLQNYANAAFSIARTFAGKNKGLAIAEATANTALAITKTFANVGYPMGIPLAAAQLAAGVEQVNQIRKQNFNRGGFPDGQNANVVLNENGQEAVLNNNAVTRLGRRNINDLNRGANPDQLFGGGGSSSTQNVEVYYSPTQTFNGGSSEDVITALREEREQFGEFLNESIKAGAINVA